MIKWFKSKDTTKQLLDEIKYQESRLEACRRENDALHQRVATLKQKLQMYEGKDGSIENFVVNWNSFIPASIERNGNQTIIATYDAKGEYRDMHYNTNMEAHLILVEQFKEAIK